MLLLCCGQDQRRGKAAPVDFSALVGDPRQYAGLTVCTEGVYFSGFEVSGLAAAMAYEDDRPQLTEPVIWLEGADVRSRHDCILTDTQPPFEFCRAVVCGLFETGASYGHGGGYAFQLRGSGVSAQPAPTATQAPAPSTLPSAAPLVVPPAALLQIDGLEQVSGIGSYCWQQATGTDTAVAVCADMAGIPTALEALVVRSPFTARFRLAPEETPDELLLEVIPVTVEDELAQWPAGWRGWTFKQGERFRLPLERESSLELSLDPGLYILSLAGWWQAWGDAGYGFLVEVQSPPPALVVEESPIVAAGLDGPGHFEYTDRLGEQLLARVEGLRAFSAGQELARQNAALAPFGYWLEARFDADWNRTFHDLYHEGQAQPVLAGLSQVWPVAVNASGTGFVFVAENAPNVSPLYLQVQTGRVEPWDAAQTAFLPPVYVGDSLARVTVTGFPTLTYQVELDDRAVYSDAASAHGAYMPLRSLTAWDGHWVLEVDDQLIQDGQDLGQALGYDAAFGFTLVGGRPFYFFEQGSRVRISYDGRALPNAYDRVFHNHCCEAAIHNVETLGEAVLFHALWNGTWYLVEAGVDDGEMAGTYRYCAPEGWSFRYPMHWDRLDEELGFVQDVVTGKTVTFASSLTILADLEGWLDAEIARKLAATEAANTLAEPLSTRRQGELTVYRYAIRSRLESSETLLRTTVFFDGQRRYEFHAAIPPVAQEEYQAILDSFRPESPSTGPVLQAGGLGIAQFGEEAEAVVARLTAELGSPHSDTGWLDPSLPASEPLWPGCPGTAARLLTWDETGLSIIVTDWAQDDRSNPGEARASIASPYFAGYGVSAVASPRLRTPEGAYPGVTLPELQALYGNRLFVSPGPDAAVGLYWFAIDGTGSPLTTTSGIRGWLFEPDIDSPGYRPGLQPGEAFETRGFTAGLS